MMTFDLVHSNQQRWKNVLEASTPTNVEELCLLFHGWNFYEQDLSCVGVGLRKYFRQYCDDHQQQQFFTDTLSFMMNLVRNLPNEFPDGCLKLLPAGTTNTLHFTRSSVASLLAASFFNLHNVTNRATEGSTYPWQVNFSSLFSTVGSDRERPEQVAKLHCLIHYFERIRVQLPLGRITVHRETHNITTTSDLGTNLMKMKVSLVDVECRDVGETIEDHGDAMLQADFANEFIGGGVLTSGCVQEEIRFVINPECLVSLFVCERLKDNEAVVITGAERFSKYVGYGRTFQYDGDYVDRTSVEGNGSETRILTSIIAIDAVPFYGRHAYRSQLRREAMSREVLKAYIGFCPPPDVVGRRCTSVATGNWGCGAFGGDRMLKCMLQWIALTMADKKMVYFPFNKHFGEQEFCAKLLKHRVTVAWLWRGLNDYGKLVSAYERENRSKVYTDDPHHDTLFEFLTKRLSFINVRLAGARDFPL